MTRFFLCILFALVALGGVGCDTDNATDPPVMEDASGEDAVAPVVCNDEVIMVGPSPARLLTRYEYDNTIRDLFGLDLMPSEGFPAENQADGWENNAYVHTVSPLLLRSYMGAAEDITATALEGGVEPLLPCDPAVEGESACGQQFIDVFAPRAFRRPLTDEERALFIARFDLFIAEFGFPAAVELTLQLTLQSPQFLYRLEGQSASEAGALEAVSGLELATRLSYLFWGSMPDDELRLAAVNGELDSIEGLEQQTRRLLADPRAAQGIIEFHRQWIGLDQLNDLIKDPLVYEGYDPSMTADWRASMDAFVTDIILTQEGSFEQLMTSPEVFLTPQLATFYGVTPTTTEGLDRYQLDEGHRQGLLTQPGLMAMLAYHDQGSPIHRGIFVRERVLCQHLDPPPAGLVVGPPAPDPDRTTRERFAEHTSELACAGCHALIDPLGFGFEHFDGVGRYREEEGGAPIDATGEMVLARDFALNGPYDGTNELVDLLVNADEVRECYIEQWMTFAFGRALTEAEACSLEGMTQAFTAEGGVIKELLIDIVLSDAFRFRLTVDRGDLP